MSNRERIEDAMRRALSLAARGPAGDPNPQVGCVIIDSDGRIVAEGWHRGAGTRHAEVDALAHLPREWEGRTGDLTAVVTLEPCNHTGRTGPCSVALAESGVGAVAYAVDDPDPVASGGADTLRAAGVEVCGGVLAAAGNELLAPWLAGHDGSTSEGSAAARPAVHSKAGVPGPVPRPQLGEAARPFITVKWAQTIDGRAAAADGNSRWITGPEARADVHRRRAAADAIAVGTGTLLADDPALTARNADGGLLVPPAEQPIPVVFGRRGIPADARINRHPAAGAAPLVFTGDDLPAHLAELRARGVHRLFVEGGPALASSFLAAGLVDELLIYVAPALLGGPRLAIGDLGVPDMAGIRRLDLSTVERLGDDLLLVAAPVARPEPATPARTPEVP